MLNASTLVNSVEAVGQTNQMELEDYVNMDPDHVHIVVLVAVNFGYMERLVAGLMVEHFNMVQYQKQSMLDQHLVKTTN